MYAGLEVQKKMKRASEGAGASKVKEGDQSAGGWEAEL